MKSALVLLAEGFEEVEAISPIDYLRRAGVAVTTLAVGDNPTVAGSHGIAVRADGLLSAWEGQADAVVVPGGGAGSKNLAASAAVGALLRTFADTGRVVAAICAAPAVVLAPLGLLAGKRFTCFPGMEGLVEGGRFSAERVVVDGRTITSRAAGSAGEFALAVAAALVGDEKAREIGQAVLLKD